MLRVVTCITTEHSLWLVAFASFICLAGCAAFVALAGQSASSTALKCNKRRTLIDSWVLSHTVWATHFVAMIGYREALPQSFGLAATLGSALVIFAVTLVAVGMTRYFDSARSRIAAGALFGVGVSCMHYLGMTGVRMNMLVEWDTAMVLSSVILAVGLGAATFWFLQDLSTLKTRLLSCLLLVLSIASLHFTGMAAITLHALPASSSILGSDKEVLLLMVGFATVLMMTIAITAYLRSGPRLLWRRNVLVMVLIFGIGVVTVSINQKNDALRQNYFELQETIADSQKLRAELDVMALERRAALLEDKLIFVTDEIYAALDALEVNRKQLIEISSRRSISSDIRSALIHDSAGTLTNLSLNEETIQYHKLVSDYFAVGGTRVDLKEMDATGLNQRFHDLALMTQLAAESVGHRYLMEQYILAIGGLLIFAYQGLAIALPGHREVVRALDDAELEKVRAERLATVARYTSDAVFIADEKGFITWANQSFVKLIQKPKDEIIGHRINAFLSQRHIDKKRFQEVIRVISQGQSISPVTAMTNANGDVIWTSMSITPTTDSTSGLTQVIHTVRDITEQKELQERVSSLALIAEHATDSVFTANQSGFITWTNDSFLDLLGRPREEVIGSRINAFLDPDLTDQIAFRDNLFKIGRGEAINVDMPVRNAQGELVWANLTANPMMDDDGVLQHTIHVARDVTKERALQDELINHRDQLSQLVEQRTQTIQNQALELETALAAERELNQMQTEFVSMASHEFRTPLTIIDGVARRLEKRADRMAPEDIRERAGNIRATIKRMTMLVERTLDASRLSSGRIKLAPEVFDAKRLITEVCNRQSEVAPSHTINLDLENFPETLFGDGRLMDNVYTNLLSNAVKYSPENPVVNVRGWTEDGMACLAVRDHGVGIPKDELPKIFERFFRASTSTGISGTGIGLNLVKNLVDMHHGRVTLDSVENEWTEIAVYLPIDSPLQNVADENEAQDVLDIAS